MGGWCRKGTESTNFIVLLIGYMRNAHSGGISTWQKTCYGCPYLPIYFLYCLNLLHFVDYAYPYYTWNSNNTCSVYISSF